MNYNKTENYIMDRNKLIKILSGNPYLQRAFWHDYTSRCIYMLTLSINPEIGTFSHIIYRKVSTGIVARWCANSVGMAIMGAVRNLNRVFPWIDVIQYTIMPDHLHLMIFVKEPGHLHLDDVVDKFSRMCMDRIFSYNNPLFSPGYNDRIVYKENQLDVYKNYVRENPYRYAIRKIYPEFFQKCNKIEIDGIKYTLYGNFLLLKNPEKSAVRISRKYSKEKMESLYGEWREIIRNKGVLVSPFYSRNEKNVRDVGIKEGVSIIKIVSNGLPERFKPYGKDFTLCVQGRLLILAPCEHISRKERLTREKCMEANSLAEKIANGVLNTRLIELYKKQ